MYEWDEFTDRENRPIIDIDRRREIIQLTSGISTHFWKEERYEFGGAEIPYEEGEKEVLLRAITYLRNLDEVRTEWPYVEWERVIASLWHAPNLDEILTALIKDPELYYVVGPIGSAVEDYFRWAAAAGLEPGKGVTGRELIETSIELSIIKRDTWWTVAEETEDGEEYVVKELNSTIGKIIVEFKPTVREGLHNRYYCQRGQPRIHAPVKIMSGQGTATEVLGKQFPAFKADIEKISRKWEQTTKNMQTVWPKGGTFDVGLCREMEGVVKNHKAKDTGKKREEKRLKELGVLRLFKERGNAVLQAWKGKREAHMARKEKEPLTDPNVGGEERPPPYNSRQGLYPVVRGIVEISGTLDSEDEGDQEGRAKRAELEGELKKNKEALKTIQNQKARVAKEQAELEESLEVIRRLQWCKQKEREVYYGDQGLGGAWGPEPGQGGGAGSARDKSKGSGKTGGQKKGKGRSAEEEKSGGKGPKEKERPGIFQEREVRWAPPPVPDNRERDSDSASSSEGEEEEIVVGRSRRSERQRRKPDRLGQFPILIKDARPQYVPWGGQDLQSLLSSLPDINEGAGQWIRTLEEETCGKMLALGDIKALLARLMGAERMRELFERARLQGVAGNPLTDGVCFDAYRNVLWQALRDVFPARLDPKTLKGEPLGETETPAGYLERQLKRWRMITERNIIGDHLMTTLFRAAILEALPPPVRARLEEVVGLSAKSHGEFNEYVIHAVEKYRKEEKRQDDQQREIQRKLLQLQLEELKKKEKDKAKKIAPMMADFMFEDTPPQAHRGQGRGGGEVPMTSITYNISGVPPTQNQGQPRGGQNWGQQQAQGGQTNKQGQSGDRRNQGNKGQNAGGQRQGQQNQNQGQGRQAQGGPQVCWGCGQPGHNRRECPTNPWEGQPQDSVQQQESGGRQINYQGSE